MPRRARMITASGHRSGAMGRSARGAWLADRAVRHVPRRL